VTLVAAVVASAAADGPLRLYAAPNPFVAGYAPARLFYTLPTHGTVSIRVYDRDGNLVRTLATNADREAGPNGRDEWNGRDRDGELVPMGPYVIVVEAKTGGEVRTDRFIAVVKR